MEILEIIREAFIFPSNNLEKLAIYIVLMFVMSLLIVGGVVSLIFAINVSSVYFILSIILWILGAIIGLVITGYQIYIIKSGIDFDEKAPEFDWENDIITGLKMVVVSIVYMIIPVIVAGIIAFITNLPGNLLQAAQEMNTLSSNATASAASISQSTFAAVTGSLTATLVVSAILFIIFAFIQTMAESRLANTGNLGQALDIPEAVKDLTRIGLGKVIAVLLLVFIVAMVINGVLSFAYDRIPALSILSIIVTPYLAFFTQRAIGLLYSDIA